MRTLVDWGHEAKSAAPRMLSPYATPSFANQAISSSSLSVAWPRLNSYEGVYLQDHLSIEFEATLHHALRIAAGSSSDSRAAVALLS